MAPKVSVVMSVYNEERHVEEAIRSILDQTFKDFEFIVVDDGSTDKTPQILRSFSDPRLKIIRQRNMGLTKALNRGISLAEGEYIARMDADDVSLPERLERQVKFLDENPEVGIVGTAYYEIDAEGRILGRERFPTRDEDLRKVLIRYNPFFHASVMIRRTVFEKVGLYDESFPYAQDYELWFRVARHFKLANLPEFLMMRRYEMKNISVALERQQIKCAVRARLKAIREGQYPRYCYIYVVKPALALVTPAPVGNWIRRHILKSRKW